MCTSKYTSAFAEPLSREPVNDGMFVVVAAAVIVAALYVIFALALAAADRSNPPATVGPMVNGATPPAASIETSEQVSRRV